MPNKNFEAELETYLRGGYQVLGISTSEEARVESLIKSVTNKLQMGMVTWDMAEGFSAPDAARKDESLKAPAKAIEKVGEDTKTFGDITAFVFRDVAEVFPQDPRSRRWLRTLAEHNRLVNQRHRHPIILVGPNLQVPPSLRACVTMLDFDLPDEEELKNVLSFVLDSVRRNGAERANASQELQESIVTNLLGLTKGEAENCLARCAVKHGGINSADVLQTIKDEKSSIVRRDQVLTYIPEQKQAARDQIGGFDAFLSWLDRRSLAYRKEAREINLDFPKGVVLIGPPGTGKSMVGVAAARLLQLPGFILDVGSVFGHLVGESEGRMSAALKTVEAQQGCVLVIDEIDKAFGGAHQASNDSGVTRRVFGKLLSWLADKQDRTFVVVTMNRAEGLPPEFFRAGRFDKVWCTDLPDEAARETIFRIHLDKRGVRHDLKPAEWAELVRRTDDFVGSEIEEVVKEARYIAWEVDHTGDPSFDQLCQAAADVQPIARLDVEGVAKIREFCKGRATPVTAPRRRRGGGARQRSVDLTGTGGDAE